MPTAWASLSTPASIFAAGVVGEEQLLAAMCCLLNQLSVYESIEYAKSAVTSDSRYVPTSAATVHAYFDDFAEDVASRGGS